MLLNHDRRTARRSTLGLGDLVLRWAQWLVLVLGVIAAPMAFVLAGTATPRFMGTWQMTVAVLLPLAVIALLARTATKYRVTAFTAALVVILLDGIWTRNSYLYGTVIAAAPVVCLILTLWRSHEFRNYVLAVTIGVTGAFASRMLVAIPTLKLQLVLLGEPVASELSFLPAAIELQIVSMLLALPALAVVLSWPYQRLRSPNEPLERSRGDAP